MVKIDEISKAVEQLDGEDLRKFQVWYDEFLELRFDQEIERDAREGKIDKLLEKAREDLKAGRIRDLR